MTNIKHKPIINYEVHFLLTETEARALSDLCSYGIESFMQIIRANLRESFVEQSDGFSSLFKSVHDNIHPQLNIIDDARRLLKTMGEVKQ